MAQAPALTNPSRVLAIDPSLRSTGYAVIEKVGTKMTALEYGTIKNAANLLQTGCLVAIHERVRALIEKHQPECAAFESVIFVQSMKTALVLGTARGAALLAAAQRGLTIHEYAPRRVKQGVVGHGGAQKGQVAFMVRALPRPTASPPPTRRDAR